MVSEDNVNVTLTLRKTHIKYLAGKKKTDDYTRSQYVRKLIDADIANNKATK